VDLPGYGYAKTAETIREKWGKMVEGYLMTSKQLKLVFLLIDIRHEPSQNDISMYQWIVYHGFMPVIIATKMDKLKRSQIAKHVKMIREGLGAGAETKIFPFSSLTKQGKDEVWAYIEDVCGLSNTEELV
jgi:GTP-binding protein